MFQYNSPEHKCDSSLLYLACFFTYISDNLYGPGFVFFTKCEFDNTDMEGTVCSEWRHVSDDDLNRVQNL